MYMWLEILYTHTHTHTHTQSLGQLGRVVLIIEDGSLIVRVNGMRWILSPLCVVPAPGEKPQDEQSM